MSSRKQSDYLSSILATDTPAPKVESAPSPQDAPRSGMTLLARESALARVASGDVKQVTQLLLDPARVRIWQGNARIQRYLTEENTRDLIDAILAEGGQKLPAVVRRISDDPNFDYEVIAGSRRHFAISWLRANSYPEMMFLAQVHNLDDEAAFRLSDVENRARTDVSDYERARAYQFALSQHYNGKQVRMAERLKVSQGWLSKMLTVAALPDWIVAAYAGPADVQLKVVYPLAQRYQFLNQESNKQAIAEIRQRAAALETEQAKLRTAGRPPLANAEVTKRLLETGDDGEASDALVKLSAHNGRTALSVVSANRNGVSVRLHAGSGATEKELQDLLGQALALLEKQGRALKL